MAQQSEDAVADQIRGGLLTANHRDNCVRDNLVVGESISIYFGAYQRGHQIVAGMCAMIFQLIAEILKHLLQAAQDDGGAIGIVLEVAEDLGEVRGPFR